MNPSEIHAKLSAPFDSSEEKQRKGPGGKMLTYIDARAVMNRLDEVVGTENWRTRMVEVKGVVVCELSIDFGSNGWVTKTDGAGESDIEGEKGQFSDAFKRAAVHFGIGRYLYGGPPKRSTSVAKTVVEEEKIKVVQELVDQGVDYIRDCIGDERVGDAMIQWAEFSNDEKVVAWSMLDSKTRAIIKKAKEPA